MCLQVGTGVSDTDSCTGGEKVYRTGRLWPEGTPSSILSLWPGLVSVKSLQGLLFTCACILSRPQVSRPQEVYMGQTNEKLNPASAAS